MADSNLDITNLLEIAKSQSREISQLKGEIANLRAINKKQREEINLLKERLGLNSTNSSLPPSRDLYRKKREEREKSNRNPGGQPGHPFQGYQALEADEIIEVISNKCSCGHNLEKGDRYIADQKIELPVIKPYVKEYRRWYSQCEQCKKIKLAPLPEGVEKDLLGNHTKAIICALNGYFHNSKREVQTILKDVFNLPISLGLVSNTTKRVNKRLEESYKRLQEQVLTSPYVHIDETGHRHKGHRSWAWMVTNKQTSVLKLSPSRGKKVLQELVGPYNGYVISDRYGGYNYFKAKNRQVCWSHLQRDFERFAHSCHPALAIKGKRLVCIAREVFAITKAVAKKLISPNVFRRRIEKNKKGLSAILKSILNLPGLEQAHRVARNLLKSFDMMWRFVQQEDVDMTNNLAERQLRKFVLYRKKLLFTWSNWGMLFVERMLSLFLSSNLRGDNPFLLLSTAINKGQ